MAAAERVIRGNAIPTMAQQSNATPALSRSVIRPQVTSWAWGVLAGKTDGRASAGLVKAYALLARARVYEPCESTYHVPPFDISVYERAVAAGNDTVSSSGPAPETDPAALFRRNLITRPSVAGTGNV